MEVTPNRARLWWRTRLKFRDPGGQFTAVSKRRRVPHQEIRRFSSFVARAAHPPKREATGHGGVEPKRQISSKCFVATSWSGRIVNRLPA